jgi:hypothetical protein
MASPQKGQPELTPKQATVVEDKRKEIRKELKKVGRANKHNWENGYRN